jgi:hypothetical protein
MAEGPQDALALQREIAEKRQDLVTNLERLRGNIRHRIEVGRQIRDRTLAIVLVGGVLLAALFFGTRARRRRRKRLF